MQTWRVLLKHFTEQTRRTFIVHADTDYDALQRGKAQAEAIKPGPWFADCGPFLVHSHSEIENHCDKCGRS